MEYNSLSAYYLGKTLVKRSTSSIYKAKNKQTQEEVWVKLINKNLSQQEMIDRQAAILKWLARFGLININRIFDTDDYKVIETPIIEGHKPIDILSDDCTISESTAIGILWSLLQKMHSAHNHNHLLLDSCEDKLTLTNGTETQLRRTLSIPALDLVREEDETRFKYYCEMEVGYIASIVLALLTGNPFLQYDSDEAIKEMMHFQRVNISRELITLLSSMLAQHSSRPSAYECLNYPLFSTSRGEFAVESFVNKIKNYEEEEFPKYHINELWIPPRCVSHC